MSLIEFEVWLPSSDLGDPPDAIFSTDDQLVDAGFNPVLWGEGDGFLKIHADHPDTQYLQRRGFVRAVRTDTSGGMFWFILEEGNVKLVSQEGEVEKVIEWSGRGMLYYLDRYKLGQAVWAPGQPFRGSVSITDHWTWVDQSMIAILTRFMEEGQNDIRADFLNKLAYDFDRTNDSNGNTPTNLTDYQVRIGSGGLVLARDAMAQGTLLTVLASTPPTLQAYRALNEYRTDRTSATFASGKVRFASGYNVATELPHKIAALRERTHTLTRRQDGQYATEALNGSGEPYMDFMDVPHTSDPDAVEAVVGESHLNRQKQVQMAVIRHLLGPGGTSGAQGYFPSPAGHYWLGDLVTVHTGSGEYDLNEQALEVAGIRYFLREGVWMAEAQLGAQALTASGSPVSPPGGGSTVITPGVPLQLCAPDFSASPALVDAMMQIADSPTVTIVHSHAGGDYTFIAFTWGSNGDVSPVPRWMYNLNGTGADLEQNFTAIDNASSPGIWILTSPNASVGSTEFRLADGSNTDGSLLAVFVVEGVFTSGDLRDWARATGSGVASSVAVDAENGDLILDFAEYDQNNLPAFVIDPGSGQNVEDTDTLNQAFGQRDVAAAMGSLVASGDATLIWDGFSASGPWDAAAVVLPGVSVPGSGPVELVGESPDAARCDHGHLIEDLLTQEDDTDLVLKPDGAGGVEWGTDETGGGGGGATQGVEVSRSANQSIAQNTNVSVQWATEVIDDNGYWDSANNTRFTAPADGWYSMNGYVKWAAQTGLGRRVLWRRSDGTFFGMHSQPGDSIHNDPYMAATAIVYMTSGQYMEFQCFQNQSAGGINIGDGRATMVQLP